MTKEEIQKIVKQELEIYDFNDAFDYERASLNVADKLSNRLEKLVSLRQEIWDKRNEFARNNYGEYPNSLIISADVNTELLKECEVMARQKLIDVGMYMGMEISVLADYRKENIIKVAKVSS